MAIARVFDGPGWTADQYGELIERMGFGAHSAPGVLFHWATVTEEGIRATDVYATQEDADRLAAESVGPLAAELGLAPPTVSQYEVLRYLEP
jgi:hypothetical protein